MARYTLELRTLMLDPNIRPYLNKALSKYPMYTPLSDNAEVKAIIPTREVLNEKLLNHYKYREIGFESIERFLDELEITMNEIMPYYNQMYNSVEIMALIDDPFGNVDVTETFKEERKDTSKSNTKSNGTDTSETTSNVNSTAKNVTSETPQTEINTPAEEINNISHADNVSWNKANSSDSATSSGSSHTDAESNGETTGSVEHTFTKKGNQGVNTYAHDMIEFRTSIIDVTMQILDDAKIKELFMQVF